jgi:hypothetical protein
VWHFVTILFAVGARSYGVYYLCRSPLRGRRGVALRCDIVRGRSPLLRGILSLLEPAPRAKGCGASLRYCSRSEPAPTGYIIFVGARSEGEGVWHFVAILFAVPDKAGQALGARSYKWIHTFRGWLATTRISTVPFILNCTDTSIDITPILSYS